MRQSDPAKSLARTEFHELFAAHLNPMADSTPTTAPKGRNGARRRLPVLLGGVSVVGVTVGGVVYWMFPGTTPAPDRFQQALRLMEGGKHVEARNIAQVLLDEGYQDLKFPAGLTYILGTAAYDDSVKADDSVFRTRALVAIGYLSEAEQHALDPDMQVHVEYMLGRLMHRLNQKADARPRLENCLNRSGVPAGVVAELLADIYQCPNYRTQERLRSARTLNDRAIELAETPEDRRRLLVQKCELLIHDGDLDAASSLISGIDLGAGDPGRLEILKARVALAGGAFAEARQVLTPLVNSDQIDRPSARDATFLMGLTYERESETLRESSPATATELRHSAVSWFQKTIDRFDQTDEGMAARLLAARLWRLEDSAEKALQSYAAVLRSIHRPQEVENRWISLDEFREQMIAAWNDWVAERRFAEAIALAEQLSPLYTRDRGYELAALAQRRWAAQIESELADSRQTVRQARDRELRLRYREAGKAYARLAESRRGSDQYGESLRLSAENFFRGGDYEHAISQLDAFLADGPDAMTATILVRRASLLLDLDRLDEAMADLKSVSEKYPTDPAVFAAWYLIGLCHLERREPEAAAAAWREVLDSTVLNPSAIEWRDSLFALGRLLFEQGSVQRRLAESHRQTDGGDLPADAWKKASGAWTESIKRLEEYVARYPASDDLPEARFLLARSRQELGEWMRWQQKSAETANRRAQLEEGRRQLLSLAYEEFQQLTEALQLAAQRDQLKPSGQSLVRNCVFEAAHTLYLLERYSEAISAYTTAVNRYPQDAQVLTAYLQMARCYNHLGKPAESRSLLEQARVILQHEQIPESAFLATSSSLSRTEWEAWLDRAGKIQP